MRAVVNDPFGVYDLDGMRLDFVRRRCDMPPSWWLERAQAWLDDHPRIKPCKSMCAGCRDDFYNGNNSLGVQECWGFKSASVVDKVGYSSIHVANGPNTIIRKTLSCWNAVSK